MLHIVPSLELDNFMRRHRHINDITLSGPLSYAVLAEMADLETVDMQFVDRDGMMVLVGLQRLKAITFCCSVNLSDDVVDFVNALAAPYRLQHLHLNGVFMADQAFFWHSLQRLKDLCQLELAGWLDDREWADGIESLMNNLPCICTIDFNRCVGDTFQRNENARVDALCHKKCIYLTCLIHLKEISPEELANPSTERTDWRLIRFGRCE